MDKYLKLLPLALVTLYSSKLLVKGAEFTDAPILMILAVLLAFYEVKLNNKAIKKLEDEITALKNANTENSKQMEEVRNHVGSLKLGQQVRLTR